MLPLALTQTRSNYSLENHEELNMTCQNGTDATLEFARRCEPMGTLRALRAMLLVSLGRSVRR